MGDRLTFSPFDKTPCEPMLKVGERATARGFFFGVVDEVPDRPNGIYVLRVDPEHEHFRPTILVSGDEISSEYDYFVYLAERDVERAKTDAGYAKADLQAAQERHRNAQEGLKVARAALRKAKKGEYPGVWEDDA